MNEFIIKLCNKICNNLFENSQQLCLSHIDKKEKLLLLINPSLNLKNQINNKLKKFCSINKNRFWIIYYRISESKIYFSCKRCKFKQNLCREYILDKIIKHIKKFDSNNESIIFKSVRKNITTIDEVYRDRLSDLTYITEEVTIQNSGDNTQEVIRRYTQKIVKEYVQKEFDFDTGSALIENALVKIEEKSIHSSIKRRLKRSALYQSHIILDELILESFNFNKHMARVLLSPTLEELLEKEKFINYIQPSIQSRFLDFVKSKTYNAELLVESSESYTELDEDEDEIDRVNHLTTQQQKIKLIFKNLSSEDAIIYKLKYGIRLDNREFLTLTYRLNYFDKSILNSFSSSEQLYIKFSIHYGIEDDSRHFSILNDIETIKTSISRKISDHRGKLESQSYIEKKEVIFMKLIYSEPLSAKEIGEVYNLTARQSDKKIARIKNKLKKMELKL